MTDLIKSKTRVLSKLCHKTKCELINLDKERVELLNLLESSIVDKEGNSCIITGPRSCGKTCLIRTVIDDLKTKYGNDSFIVINLSGYAQSDDKMAVREISRQLDQELVKYGTNSTNLEKKRISDTLLALLSILEPEEELSDDEDDDDDKNSTDESNKQLKTSIILILEEVDRFTLASKQTLLYNFLDIAQSSSIGVALVGITTRMNAREMMEKRVRSRFSQRIFSIRRPTSLDSFWRICRSNLIMDDQSIIALEWNEHIDKLYQDEMSNLRFLVEQVFLTTKDVRQFNNRMIYAVNQADYLLKDDDIIKYFKEQDLADSEKFILGLSELELALLISGARTSIKFETDSINFNLAYDEYHQMSLGFRQERAGISNDTAVGYRIWSKEVARCAWESLEKMNLILPLNNYSDIKKGITSVHQELKMVKIDVTLMELRLLLGKAHILSAWTKL